MTPLWPGIDQLRSALQYCLKRLEKYKRENERLREENGKLTMALHEKTVLLADLDKMVCNCIEILGIRND